MLELENEDDEEVRHTAFLNFATAADIALVRRESRVSLRSPVLHVDWGAIRLESSTASLVSFNAKKTYS